MVPHIAVGALLRTVRRVLAVALFAVAVVIAIGGAVIAQAGRDEASAADAAVLMLEGTEAGKAARLDRAVRLYLAGQISRIVLVGRETTAGRDALVERGVVPDKILETHGATALEQIRAVRTLLHDMEVRDAMLLGEPVEALRLLKIARDHHLLLHSAPTGAESTISVNSVANEVGRYLVYCFAGR
jgi:hypothetical protein